MTHREATITWLGHATLQIETPEDRRILVDPWIDGNPGFPEDANPPEQLDGMVLTHGHFDHTDDAVQYALEHQPQVVGVFEVATWLENHGAENVVPMNEGGTFHSEELGVDLTAVHAQHSSCVMNDDDSLGPGGVSVGWIIDFSTGKTLYCSGDTNVFGDMSLIRELYEPDLAVLPIGDHFTMGPEEACKAIELLDADRVLPVHYGTFPVLTGTPDALKAELDSTRAEAVEAVAPGESVQL